MVDMCGRGWKANTSSDAHCIARASWKDTYVTEGWGSSLPLQLGGLAHKSLHSADFGWSNTLVHQALDGCISHLTVNGEVASRSKSFLLNLIGILYHKPHLQRQKTYFWFQEPLHSDFFFQLPLPPLWLKS